MENLLLGIIAILLIIIVILVIKIILDKHALNEIIRSFDDAISQDTNLQIRVNTGDSHIRKLAHRLNKELEKLRQTSITYTRGNSELNTAIVNISHDLRTPLTAIGGYLELLENEEKSEEAAKYLEIIGGRVEAMKILTEELFKYSIVTSDNDDFNPENLSLNSELENAIASLYGAFVSKDITPEIDMPDAKVMRVLDHKSVQRIFSNILNNALKYSEGDVKIKLTEDGTISFSNKANLTPTDVGKLFNRFYTVESAHHSTGIGLSIAKLLTEKNGGTIEAKMEGDELHMVIYFPDKR